MSRHRNVKNLNLDDYDDGYDDDYYDNSEEGNSSLRGTDATSQGDGASTSSLKPQQQAKAAFKGLKSLNSLSGLSSLARPPAALGVQSTLKLSQTGSLRSMGNNTSTGSVISSALSSLSISTPNRPAAMQSSARTRLVGLSSLSATKPTLTETYASLNKQPRLGANIKREPSLDKPPDRFSSQSVCFNQLPLLAPPSFIAKVLCKSPKRRLLTLDYYQNADADDQFDFAEPSPDDTVLLAQSNLKQAVKKAAPVKAAVAKKVKKSVSTKEAAIVIEKDMKAMSIQPKPDPPKQKLKVDIKAELSKRKATKQGINLVVVGHVDAGS